MIVAYQVSGAAEVIDLTAPGPVWRYTGAMAYPPPTVQYHPAVLAPGGTSAIGFTDPAGAAHAAEMWDPAPGGVPSVGRTLRIG
jgi:hypothetical protein